MTKKRKAIWCLAKPLFVGIVVVFCSGAAGEICGGLLEKKADAFGPDFIDNNAQQVISVLSRVEAGDKSDNPENSSKIPIAVAVVKTEPRAVIAWNLESGKELWTINASVGSELTVSGDLVIFKSGSEVQAHGIADGQLRWRYSIDEGWDFFGADVDGDLAAIALGIGGGNGESYANGKLIAFKASTGAKLWEHISGGGLVGRPAVANGIVFAPWEKQKIVAINNDTGREISRIRAADYTINHVEAENGGVYYGMLPTTTTSSAIFRFDESSITGKREGSHLFAPDLKPVPGNPSFHRDAFAKPIAGRSSNEKMRFHWKPDPSQNEPIAMCDKQFYLHYWRYIIAFDLITSRPNWTYSREADIEAMKVVKGGVVGIDSKGSIFFVDAASGKSEWSIDTGKEILAAAFDADGFIPQKSSSAKDDPIKGLLNLISDRDNRMLPIRSWAVWLIARERVPEVTRDLLDIYSIATTPSGLKKTIGEVLDLRKIGSEYLVQALDKEYDFLKQVNSPPMNLIAPVLASADNRSAVPGLVKQLLSHETPAEYLTPIVMSIQKLGDSSVVPVLKQFMTQYHADSSLTGYEQALVALAETIIKLGDRDEGMKYVVSIRDDKQTLPELNTVLAGMILDPAAIAKAEAGVKAKAEAEKKVKEEEAAARAEAAKFVPKNLKIEVINKTINDNIKAFVPCAKDATEKAPQIAIVRLTFIITGTTRKISNLYLIPNNIPGLAECLTSAFDTFQFPKFEDLRQMASYSLRIDEVASMSQAEQQTNTGAAVEQQPESKPSDSNPAEKQPEPTK